MWKAYRRFKKRPLMVWVGLMILVLHISLGMGALLSPTQVVHLWMQLYPDQMAQAARLTTSNLRDGLSVEEWTQKRERAMKDLQFRYLGGKVISENVNGDQATVVFQAKFSTLLGKQIQEERYRLQKQLDGGWLIEQIEFGPDHVLRQIT